MICREIGTPDIAAVVDLLTAGFPRRDRSFWEQALARLSRHAPPAGAPRFGMLLECDGRPVGVLLTIFSLAPQKLGDPPETRPMRCNVSSWYVMPEYRMYGPLLVARALRRSDVTYTNLTSIAASRPILHAQGYCRFAAGLFHALPALARGRDEVALRPYRPEIAEPGLSISERQLLADHVGWGCHALICETQRAVYPFVVAPRRRGGVSIHALLAYCRSLDSFVQCARPIGVYLARRGCLVIGIHTDGPIPNLPGLFRGDRPAFCRGAHPPPPGDLAYSERVMFGS